MPSSGQNNLQVILKSMKTVVVHVWKPRKSMIVWPLEVGIVAEVSSQKCPRSRKSHQTYYEVREELR